MYKNKEDLKAWSKNYYIKNHKRVLINHKKSRIKTRMKVLIHYSSSSTPFCECCKENQYEFLCIDHIKGGGTLHRKSIGENLDRWLIRNNFPEGFQVLCHNCNTAKGKNGICPHKINMVSVV